jgi:hypothetical protein
MPGAALRGARGTLRVHPARRPISALPTALLAYRSSDMLAALVRQAHAGWDLLIALGALISGADRAIFGRSSGAGP